MSEESKFSDLEKRVRDLETALEKQIATCSQSHEHAREEMTSTRSCVEDLRGDINALMKDKDKRAGMTQGVRLAFEIIKYIIFAGSVLLNVYFMIAG